ncbi:Phosphatidylinositol 3- and 4-kinase [Musa troglodytarum]|uniref:Phosphatidylinositol 3- and 4-kinase n=1 Tax=Musa troglodytarum TaxID=320322 RepID=A0A9E7HPR2_9LILI|nr:Phosphatidylinositol 3- and 4-kinase [Musa troglodytarum]
MWWDPRPWSFCSGRTNGSHAITYAPDSVSAPCQRVRTCRALRAGARRQSIENLTDKARRVFFSCVSLRLMLPALHKSRAGEGRVGGEGPDPPPWDRPPDLIPVVGRRGAGACLLSGEISPPREEEEEKEKHLLCCNLCL